MKINITNKIYNDEDAARAHLEEQLWPDGPVCPHCQSKNATALTGKAHRKGLYQCNDCREQFSVTVGTVFERSKIDLHEWVLAAHLMGASKKGMSSKQIQRMLGISYKSAWFVMHRIRLAMSPADVKDSGPLGGRGQTVESDETFVGGKAKNAKKGKPIPKKYPVVALVERGGEMRAHHVADVTAKTVRSVIVTQVSRKSELHTDDSLVYYWLGREFEKPRSVNHSKDEYVSKDAKAHVNTCESFFAILKRGINGSFHSVSEQHLRYVDEFAFRWNTRSANGIEDFERAALILKGANGKRLTYRPTDKARDA
jgi:transposase-like protein